MSAESHSRFRRTRIVCTLGPACAGVEMLARLIEAGMDIARFNFSHGDHDSHARTLEDLRQAARKAGRPVGVLQDLCGPKIRVGNMPGGAVELKDGQEVTFFTGPAGEAPPDALSVEYEALHRDCRPGDRILFDDGALEAQVLSAAENKVRVRFKRGGTLKSRKGMNLPGVKVSAPSVTEKDLHDLEWGLKNEVDFVALSFVRDPEDLKAVRTRLNTIADPPLLISKIEKPEAVSKLEAIVEASDAVMVARGDLGVEMAFETVPAIQKRLIGLCNRSDKPVITATQMLESMTQNPRPTRAEVSDVSNAILDGSDAVMLSGETAAGRYPVESVAAMRTIAEEAEHFSLCGRQEGARNAGEHEASSLHDALALGVERIARSLEIKAIAVVTQSGATARFVASSRPRVPVVALSPSQRALRRMCLYWGVMPLPCSGRGDANDVLRDAETAVRRQGLANTGDTIVVAVGREGSGEFSGRIHIHRLEKEFQSLTMILKRDTQRIEK